MSNSPGSHSVAAVRSPGHPADRTGTSAAVTAFVFLMFFCSGAFSLVYEVSWVRAITLEFGSTALAVSTVLTIFMGGLALGARVAGRRADALRRPLLAYGMIEVVLAGYAGLTPYLVGHLLPRFGALAYPFSDHMLTLSLVRFTASAFFLLFPTVLMGATLPILSHFWAVRREDAGRGAALLYGVNTMGAFVGTVLGGAVLLSQVGLVGTLYLVSALNAVLGVGAMSVSWFVERGRARGAAPGPAIVPETSLAPDAPVAGPGIFVAVCLTGFAGMVCQVAWTRVLILVLGASTYAFTVVLATFLCGLGVGAYGVAVLLRASAAGAAPAVFFWLAVVGAALVSLASALFQHLPAAFVAIFRALSGEADFSLLVLAQFLVAASVMLPPTLVLGGLFPAAVRVLGPTRRGVAESVGRLYAWNTIGAILGALAAGFGLVPALGLRGTLLTAAGALVSAGVVAVFGASPRRRFAFAGVGAAVLLAVLVGTPAWNQQLMTSAVFNMPNSPASEAAGETVQRILDAFRLVHYEDGLLSTVTVVQGVKQGELAITNNGKFEGSNFGDMPTQQLLAHVPLLLHPDPRSVCIVGMGTGVTAGTATLHPGAKIDLVEIEPAVVRASKYFTNVNRNVLDNKNVSTKIADGRLYLKTHANAYDVIISEPSNPWMAGSSDLFTSEFFALGSASLKKGGLFCQWFQLYSMSPESVATVVRTFLSVFPHAYLGMTIRGVDLILVGSQEPIPLDLARLADRIRHPWVRADLLSPMLQIQDEYDLLSTLIMGTENMREFSGEGVLHTDDLPVLAYTAPRDLYRDNRNDNLRLFTERSKGIAADLVRDGERPSPDDYAKMADAYLRFLGRTTAEAVTRSYVP